MICRLCGGIIGPDITDRPMCYACGPPGMRKNPTAIASPQEALYVLAIGQYWPQDEMVKESIRVLQELIDSWRPA